MKHRKHVGERKQQMWSSVNLTQSVSPPPGGLPSPLSSPPTVGARGAPPRLHVGFRARRPRVERLATKTAQSPASKSASLHAQLLRDLNKRIQLPLKVCSWFTFYIHGQRGRNAERYWLVSSFSCRRHLGFATRGQQPCCERLTKTQITYKLQVSGRDLSISVKPRPKASPASDSKCTIVY